MTIEDARGMIVKKIRISEELLIGILNEGCASCEAIEGIPKKSFIIGARHNFALACLEIDIASDDWQTEGDEFIPIFRRIHTEEPA
jgi:hypothetical protein